MSILMLAYLQGTVVQAQPNLTFRLETKTHYRDSKASRYPIPFPFPDFFLPPGETQGAVETVEAGGHFEVSQLSLVSDLEWGEDWHAHGKIDVIDLYDRNPTSGDRQWDLDEVWVRYGQEVTPDILPDTPSFYIKLGKFGRFERQDDRHLESYGLVSTAFNRFEDAGLEAGYDINRHISIKASYTTGNPIFIRDPNTLAGDNGIEEINPFTNPNPDPARKSGIVLFYDAEIEGPEFGSGSELSGALGFRFGDQLGRRMAHVQLAYAIRDLRQNVDLRGTFYGGDLDLLAGVDELGLESGLPTDSSEDKTEFTATTWIYFDRATGFLQYVDHDIDGLKRTGYEAEFSYSITLPIWWAFAGHQILPSVMPAVRYSKLSPDFTGNGMLFPAPSVWWDWKKLDLGVTARLYRGWRLTFEYADNQFLRSGTWEHNDEYLATLRWRLSSESVR